MPNHPSTNQSSKASNTALARRKALSTYVYISGLTGAHTLETGLAYYYRGHYIYAYPAGNLIEPIPYSTRKGIMIQGVLDAKAPVYDADARGLRGESEVRALELSVQGEVIRKAAIELAPWGASEKVAGVVETLKPSGRPESPALRRTPPGEDLHRCVTSLAALRESGLEAFTPRHGVSFLAASAPGSRLASRSASPSGLRPTSSHVGLARLGALRGRSFPSANAHYLEADVSVESVSSRPSSTTHLPGLGDHALSAGDLVRSTVSARVKPCAIHGEECDGIFVERTCLTEETKKGLGFVEEVPMIEARGRQMVDWAMLLQEVRPE